MLTTVSSLLINMSYPVYIDQGLKQNISQGYASASDPNLLIDTTSIQNGSITTSINIGKGLYVRNRWINQTSKIEITDTSTFTGNLTTPTVTHHL